jgi:hypothetical protein
MSSTSVPLCQPDVVHFVQEAGHTNTVYGTVLSEVARSKLIEPAGKVRWYVYPLLALVETVGLNNL